MRTLIVVALMASPAFIVAETLKPNTIYAKWDRPTRRENGAPMPADELAKYELEYVNMETSVRKTKQPKATLTAYEIPSVPAGKYGVRIRAYDTTGLVSKWSPQVTTTVKDASTCTCP